MILFYLTVTIENYSSAVKAKTLKRLNSQDNKNSLVAYFHCGSHCFLKYKEDQPFIISNAEPGIVLKVNFHADTLTFETQPSLRCPIFADSQFFVQKENSSKAIKTFLAIVWI